jgi:hypothetical protein
MTSSRLEEVLKTVKALEEQQQEMAQLVTSLAKQNGIDIDDQPVKKN